MLTKHCVLPLANPVPPNNRLIQEADERQHRAKGLDGQGVEFRGPRHLRFQAASCQELFHPQVIASRMIGGITARHTDELFARNISEQAAERARFNDGTKLAPVVGNVRAQRCEVLGKRHIQATANKDLVAADMQIESCSLVLAKALARENRGHMGLIRSFVFRKTRIPIYPVSGGLWRGDHLRREVLEVLGERRNQPVHGGLQLGLINTFSLLKPFAIIMSLQ